MAFAPAPAPGSFTPSLAKVTAKRSEIGDVVTLDLETPPGSMEHARPGQFNMLYAFGVGEVAISISGNANGRLEHTIRAVGAVSQALADLEPGTSIGIRGPFGAGWPVGTQTDKNKDIVIVAGGLGLAPLRPVVRDILAHRDRYGRVFILVGSRNPEAILYDEELRDWRKRFDLEVEVTVDYAGRGWRGNVGAVTCLIGNAGFDPESSVAMVCGPEIMMRFVAGALVDAGMPDHRIHLSMERNMKCAVGLCGRCQFGPTFICKDGPVMSYDTLRPLLAIGEL